MAVTAKKGQRLSKNTWQAILTFLALAFGGMSICAVVVLVSPGGLSGPVGGAAVRLVMFVPALSALLVVILVERSSDRIRSLGIGPIRPVGRTLAYSLLGIALALVFSLGGLGVATLLGVYRFDLSSFSGYEELLRSSDRPLRQPIQLLVVAQLVAIPVGSVFNVVFTAGEEIGWRGWLLPKLLPLGSFWAVVVSGAIWGLWHAPLVLLGYNYGPGAGPIGVLAMICSCIVVGGFLAWLRLKSRTIWPGAIAHGVINAAAGLVLVLYAAGTRALTLEVTLLGWTGWILPGLFLTVVALTPGLGLGSSRRGRRRESHEVNNG